MSSIDLYIGDCRDSLRQLAAVGVKAQTCVTSPPYFGLRDYGTAEWVGGDAACMHIVGEFRTGAGMIALGEQYRGGGRKATASKPVYAKDVCPHCEAIRVDRQIGIENTPDEYIAKMVDVFRCVRDVLADDGTLWLNIGDSYVGSMSQHKDSGSFGKTTCISKKTQGGIPQSGRVERNKRMREDGIKPKDLIGIPWLLAFALRADGWYLRQDIIWHKPNPMPESVRDRCTKSHEYMFLLSKSSRYFYDAKAIEEPAKWERWGDQTENKKHQGTAAHLGGKSLAELPIRDKKNKRSVWSVATKGYKGAHFAVFPPSLIEPCVLAGSRPGDIVIDPFGGSGTVSAVASQHGRSSVLCELSPDFAALVPDRVASVSGKHTPIRVHGDTGDIHKYVTLRSDDL